jgi:hypothetical protein
VNNSQGQSRATIDKERRIGLMLAVTMRIVHAKFARSRFCYFHCDANAGSGRNEMIGVPGSPVVFWELAAQYLPNMRFAAFFAEIEASRAVTLQRAVPQPYQHCSFVLPGDNDEVLEVFAEFIRRSGERPDMAMGTVLVDPNGWFYRDANGRGAPVNRLCAFAKEFPRIDLALNLNARTYRLQRGRGHSVPSTEEVMLSLGKQHWLVAEANYGGSHFLLLVGRNKATSGHRALGMHPLDSDAGRYIVNRAEGRRQGDLFGAL